MKKIEKIHSKFGVIKLSMEMEESTNPSISSTILFKYPSGEYMGSWDENVGGGLGYPSEEVNKFMRLYEIHLLDFDEEGYLELEKILEEEARKEYPNFFI